MQPLLLPPGGMAVALTIDGRTEFFNFGMADTARKQAMTSDALFNLASVGKVFTSTLLAQAVKRGEVALDDPVAKYVTELQQGGDIRKVTLGQLASHTSGLHRVPQQYETWHRGQYSLPDFIRYLNAWQADDGHSPASRTSIPTPASCCWRWRCSAASTCRTGSSWSSACWRRSA